MIAIIIFAIISLWGIISYFQDRKSHFLLALFLVLSNCINLLPNSVYVEDFTLIMCLSAIFCDLNRGENVFSLRGDSVGILIVILLCYYLIVVVWTVLQGKETIIYALKVYRRDLFYLYYFVFKRISVSDVKEVFRPFLLLSIIGGVLYYLQFVGIHILSNASDEMVVVDGGFERYLNTPLLGIPFLIYMVIVDDDVPLWLLLFFLGFLIMPMSRGSIIAAIISISYYIYRSGKFYSYKQIVIKMLFFMLLFLPVLVFRFVSDNERGTALQDISSASSITDPDDFDYGEGGTFTFRIALAIERLNYMINNPQTLIAGVGAIHEQSPNNKFDFFIGTNFTTVDGDERKQNIDTEDIAFVSHTFRYGFVYFLLFLYFIEACYARFKSAMASHAVGAVGFVYFLLLVINGFSSDVYSFLRLMFIPLLLLAMIQTCNEDELEELGSIR